jgi:hypothetical protein
MKFTTAFIIDDFHIDRDLIAAYLQEECPNVKIIEISDTLDGYSPSDLEKYIPDKSTVLFVEDSYLSQSEYLRRSLFDSNSGSVALISDSPDIMTDLDVRGAKLLLRPIHKHDIAEIINPKSRLLNDKSSASDSDPSGQCISEPEEDSGESYRDYRYGNTDESFRVSGLLSAD